MCNATSKHNKSFHHGGRMRTRPYKIFSGILIVFCLFLVALPVAVLATPIQVANAQFPTTKHEPKRGFNPETGKLSFIGGGDPINVPGIRNTSALAPRDRAMDIADLYGKEFGLKNPGQELKLLKSEKDSNGK